MTTADMLSKDQKFYSMQDLKLKGFTQYRVAKLVEAGHLIKLNKRYYENAGYAGEESDFYYIEAYIPNGVICLLSAASYYNLTTYIPAAIDVAIPRKARVSAMPEWPCINVHHYTDARYMLGICKVAEGGNIFKIYDIEKTVVDIVFYREKIGIEETKEVLTAYLRQSNVDLHVLLRYAEMMKCDKTLRKYLEVLI